MTDVHVAGAPCPAPVLVRSSPRVLTLSWRTRDWWAEACSGQVVGAPWHPGRKMGNSKGAECVGLVRPGRASWRR